MDGRKRPECVKSLHVCVETVALQMMFGASGSGVAWSAMWSRAL